jgi:hypothetical protein
MRPYSGLSHPIFWLWPYLMKVSPEMRYVRYSIYQRLYYINDVHPVIHQGWHFTHMWKTIACSSLSWKAWAHITSLPLYSFIDKVIKTVNNILLYKMYPSWCTNCNVSLQGQIPTFILVTCLLYISSDNKNKVKNLSFPYLDSKTIHTYTPWHIDIQEETSIIPALYVLQVGV